MSTTSGKDTIHNFWRKLGVQDLNQALTSAKGRRVLLDLYADWCVECKRMEQTTFSDKTLREGIEQTADYADRCDADEAHLLLFDRRIGMNWDEGIWQRQESHGKWTITVWGA